MMTSADTSASASKDDVNSFPGEADTNSQDNIDSDDSVSELERRIASIDLRGFSSLQRPLERNKKQELYAYSKSCCISSVWNHSCGVCGSAASCFPKDERLSTDTSPDGNRNVTRESSETEHEFHAQKPLDTEKLPVELWAQIFYLCLPSDDFITPNPRQAPLLLCQICTSWRNISTGTPLLWSALSIRGSWCKHVWKSSLECWLKRAGNAFLYLDICLPLYLEPIFTGHIQKLLTASASRWRHLRLSLTNPLLCSMLNNHMPVLRTLEFSSPFPLSSLNIESSHVPNLKSVSLLTKSLYIQPLSLPWHQLVHLSSQCWLNIRQHLDILRKCSNLESYTMRVVDAETAHSLPPILIHPLRTLEVIPFVGSAIGLVLKCLQLPNLTTLTLIVPDESPSYGMTTWPQTHVLSLLERSSCSLIHLYFKGIITSEEILIAIKHSIPSLISIELQ